MSEKRYRVQFTPVGWHVLDTVETRDPVAEFGGGPEEYQRAKAEAERLNTAAVETELRAGSPSGCSGRPAAADPAELRNWDWRL